MEEIVEIKTPISYYGGKQNMVRHILPLIPVHNLYCEPFVGGGAVYWKKEPSKVEVINDTNKDILKEYVIANGWHTKAIEQKISVNNKSGKTKAKTEMLTANYVLEGIM